MARTKKVWRAGRFGSRYGKKLRVRTIDIERDLKQAHTCSSCLKPTLRRVTSGVWACSRCGSKMAGKAYRPA